MNAGQYLVALSGLPSGSAGTHLLAIQAGTGTGPGQTIFSSRMCVVASESRMEVVLRSKREAPRAEPTPPHAPEKRMPARSKAAHCVTTTPRLSVLTHEESIVVIQKTKPVISTSQLSKVVARTGGKHGN